MKVHSGGPVCLRSGASIYIANVDQVPSGDQLSSAQKFQDIPVTQVIHQDERVGMSWK
jgi:hypothetical protein